MKNITWLKEVELALQELPDAFNVPEKEITFTFHSFFKVGVGPEAKSSLEHIFGKLSWSQRISTFMRMKAEPTYKLKAPLPPDAVIHFRENKRGVIISSAQVGRVLKVFLDTKAIATLNDEISVLEKIGSTSFAPYSPKLITYGTTSQGARWHLTSFESNYEALGKKWLPDLYLIKNFDSLIMPKMTHYYLGHEFQVNEAKIRSQNHPAVKVLNQLLNEVQKEILKHPNYQVVEAQIHHDLHLGNILFDGQKTVIIDWEGGIKSLTIIDIVDFVRRYLNSFPISRLSFKLFLKGHCKTPPSKVRRAFAFYREWMKASFKAEVPNNSEKLSILVYVIERSLILFEKRGVNRLSDKRGFEYLVAQNL